MRANLRPALLALSLVACGDDNPPAPAADVVADAAVSDADTGEDTAAPPCDPSRPAVVMAHGFLAAGDTWAPFAQRLVANGDCPERLFAFDWNPFDRNAAPAQLDAFIDGVIAETGAAQVQLVGHSAGGSLGWGYLLDPVRAAKVSHYVHVGSSPAPDGEATLPSAGPADAPVPTLNIWSAGDAVVPGADIPGAENARFETLDHYEVATSPEAFAALYRHLRGAEPATTDRAAAPAATPGLRTISGKALTLGENVPVAGWTVAIFPVDPATGLEASEEPVATFTVAADGAFGPATVAADTPHVFVLEGLAPGDRSVRYYREPFVADDAFVYLRALPGEESLVGILLGTIPFSADSSVLIAFSASRGVLAGRDTLSLNGEALSIPAFASAERTAIAWFFFDDGEDGQGGAAEETVATFAVLPSFLVALDRPLPVAAEGPFTLELNGRSLRMPRLPAASDGALVAIFD